MTIQLTSFADKTTQLSHRKNGNNVDSVRTEDDLPETEKLNNIVNSGFKLRIGNENTS